MRIELHSEVIYRARSSDYLDSEKVIVMNLLIVQSIIVFLAYKTCGYGLSFNATSLQPETLGDSWETIVAEGILHIEATSTSFLGYIVTGNPPWAGAYRDKDFKQTRISVQDRQSSRLVREENTAANPAHWKTPWLVNFPTSSRFATWQLREWQWNLEEALTVITAAGFVGPWKQVKVLKFRVNPFSEPSEELYFGLRTRATEYPEWIFVGMSLHVVHRLVTEINDNEILPLGVGNATSTVATS